MTQARRAATPKLTAKGAATRARIVEQAARLMYAHGVHGTNNEQLRHAAGVSGSQLSYHFPDKQSLVLAVVAWRGEQVLALHGQGRFAGLDSIAALRAWAGFWTSYRPACHEGCTLGSLASEIVKTDLDARAALATQFEGWRHLLRAGLERMCHRGELTARADPARLTNLLLATLQGGFLLAQVARDITPLQDALSAAIDHVESLAADRTGDRTADHATDRATDRTADPGPRPGP